MTLHNNCLLLTYAQGNRPAMNRRRATLANSSLREGSARTQFANSFIVSLRWVMGSGCKSSSRQDSGGPSVVRPEQIHCKSSTSRSLLELWV